MNEIVFTWDNSTFPDSTIAFDCGKIRMQLDKDNLLYITNLQTNHAFGLEKRYLKSVSVHPAAFLSPGSLFVNWDAKVSSHIAHVLDGIKLIKITNKNEELTGVHLKFKSSANASLASFLKILEENGCLIV